MKELDTATKLLNDGHYAMSILETFKALMTHLYKKLLEKQIRVSPNRTNDLIELSRRYEIIKAEDVDNIVMIRQMRNAVAHTTADFSKEDAIKSREITMQIISRS